MVNPRPVFGLSAQPFAIRIHPDIFHLPGKLMVGSKPVIKEVTLPDHARLAR
jgi:hypothetical protein